MPSAAKWNILGTNDASFNDGTGIADATITPDHLATGADSAVVATSQATASTSFTDLATSGPAVTVTIGANGLALVAIQCLLYTSGAGVGGRMGFALSGANTVAASDTRVVRNSNIYINQGAAVFLLEGLAAGSTTFTAKYVTSSGTATFENREILVIPL